MFHYVFVWKSIDRQKYIVHTVMAKGCQKMFKSLKKITGIQVNYLYKAIGFAMTSLCALSVYAADAEPIGYVMKVSGDASVVSAGKSIPAKVGTPVVEGSTLRVGANSAMGVTLKDNTVMSLGPNSEMVIDEYLYAPAKNDLKLTTRMVHGTLNFISGVIAKLRPEAVQINTPTGTIGVRGTHFLVKVDE